MKTSTLIPSVERIEAVYLRARTRAAAYSRPVLTAISFETPPLQPLDLFAALDGDAVPCTLWESRASGLGLFGWGCEQELHPPAEQPLSELNREWADLAGEAIVDGPVQPLLLGGQVFGQPGQVPGTDHRQHFARSFRHLAQACGHVAVAFGNDGGVQCRSGLGKFAKARFEHVTGF